MRYSRTASALGLAAALAITPSIALAAPAALDDEAAADSLTLLATTDQHGTVLDYDYFTGEPFGDRGMERLSSAITEVRTDKGAESVLLLDNGDANQGNPLESVYHSNRAEDTTDPIASLMNHLDYDTGVAGNHEFNYGLEDLAQYQNDLDMPLLGANVIEDATGDPYLDPWTMITKTSAEGVEVDVAVIGVVTPGVRIWDRLHVQGTLTFEDIVTTVQHYVPIVEGEGADVVVVMAHTGLDAEGYVWDPADLEENVATSIAQNVEGIDVIVGGHSHVTDKVEVYFENPAGDEVLYTQPGYHARFLSHVTIPLEADDAGNIDVVWTEDLKPSAVALQAADYDADPAIEGVIDPWHEMTLEWVAQVVAQATETMSAATSVYEDTAIVDFISKVQTDEAERAFAGTEYEDLPIVSAAAPFSRTAVFNEGDVTVADMASLYIYDNTLMAVELSGAEVLDYLEYAARYYAQVEEDSEINWDEVTNALYPGETRGIPDYAYDILSGVNYHINISKPVGERIENLTYADGTPVGADDRIAFVLNNYRQSGGSGYPNVVDAPVIYNEQQAIRDLMIDWAIDNEVINPDDFFVENWTVSSSTVLEDDPLISSLTLLATTDQHGTVLDYDYFTGEPFGDRGMERLSTAITEVRADKGMESVLLLDNGDANQGNPLESVYHSNRAGDTTDPIASLMNHLGYDAGVAGNHEFNYGMEDLAQYQDDLDMPLLGANVIADATGQPYLDPWTMITKTTAEGHEVDVAVIGVVTPGVRIWDRLHVQGILTFEDMVTAVDRYIPEVEAAGADVVVVMAHTGLDAEGYVWDPADLEENVAQSIAENVEGIDVIVGGHSHVTDKVEVYFENPAGDEVLYTQPGYHARFLSHVTIPLEIVGDDVDVVWTEDLKPSAVAENATDYEADPAIAAVIDPWHDMTLVWVAQVVAQATETMSAATSVYEDTAIVDFISKVQTDEAERAFAGTEYEDLPIVSAAAPFSRTAVFNEGDVTVADMASLYIYDNTLMAVELTGAELADYLEYGARYYAQVEEDSEIDWDEVTNALYPGETRGIPDYAYDILSGVNYHINISKPVGERIENLTYPDGSPIGADDRIAFVLNNYRQSGGSGYPHVVEAEVIYNEQQAIRDLMIDWAIDNEVINPDDFFVENWTVSSSTTIEGPTVPDSGNTFYLSNDWTSPTHELAFAYGRIGDEVFVGDWDGDGKDTLGVRRGNTFYLMNELVGGNADSEFNFGRKADEVHVGDWDGDGKDTLGVRRGHTFYLMNELVGGNAEIEFKFGKTSDEALAGDWDGDGKDTLAVRRGNTFYIMNELIGGNAEKSYNYGRAGDLAFAGDFDGDGTDTILLVRGKTFFVNNSHVGGTADLVLTYGRHGDTVFVGDWDGDGIDTPGVNRVK